MKDDPMDLAERARRLASQEDIITCEILLLCADEIERATGYAQRLATSLWEQHWKADSPNWKPLPDLLGVLTQIDNMTAGLERTALTGREADPTMKAEMTDAAQVDRYIALLNAEIADNGLLRDEIERLRDEVDRLQSNLKEWVMAAEIERKAALTGREGAQ